MENNYSEVINNIQKEHHKYLKEELPVLHDLVYKILRVHYPDNGKLLEQVHKLFGNLSTELELIMVKRQIALYPAIYDYNKDKSGDNKNILEDEVKKIKLEYDIVEDTLKEMRSITDGYTMPPSGCSTFETTYRKLEQLEKDVLQSIKDESQVYG